MIVFTVGYISFGDYLLEKFTNVGISSIGELVEISERTGRGGSGYKAGLSISNPILDFIVNTPIRVAYFGLSPMPWNWRGIGDILAFGFSSLYYLIGFYYVYKAYKHKKEKDNKWNLMMACFIIILLGYVVFSWGVSNAGTAMRHRDKFLPIYIVMLSTGIECSNNVLKIRKQS